MVGGIATSGRHGDRGGKLRAHIFKYKQKAESEPEVVQGF